MSEEKDTIPKIIDPIISFNYDQIVKFSKWWNKQNLEYENYEINLADMQIYRYARLDEDSMYYDGITLFVKWWNHKYFNVESSKISIKDIHTYRFQKINEVRIIKHETLENGYYIGLKYVLSTNWSVPKYKFSELEQLAFESKVPTLELKYLEWLQVFRITHNGTIYKVGATIIGDNIGCHYKSETKEENRFEKEIEYLDRETLVIPLKKLFDN